MTTTYHTRTLSTLATEIAGATAVFRKYKLDFCCGGNVPLTEAAEAKGLDADSIAADLAALAPVAQEVPREPTALIAHILTRYHEVHRRELPELIRLAKRVEAVHGARPDAPNGTAALLQAIAQELEEHMQKEERVLFPLMETGGSPFIHHPISVMRAEHEAVGAQLKQLEAVLGTAPDDACATWRALHTGVVKFIDDLMNHVHLENNVLFPAFEISQEAGHHESCGCGS